MRCGRQQDQPPFRLAGQPPEQSEPLLPALVSAHAGMCLVHDSEVRAGSRKPLPPLFGLDVIEADYGMGVGVEQRLRHRQTALQARGRTRGDRCRVDAEAIIQFVRPLLDQVRRAQHRECIHLSAVHEFAQYEAGLDGFADAHVVGDQQAGYGQAKRHQERHQLVDSRFERQLRGGTEGACAAPQRQPQRIAEQRRPGLYGGHGIARANRI